MDIDLSVLKTLEREAETALGEDLVQRDRLLDVIRRDFLPQLEHDPGRLDLHGLQLVREPGRGLVEGQGLEDRVAVVEDHQRARHAADSRKGDAGRSSARHHR